MDPLTMSAVFGGIDAVTGIGTNLLNYGHQRDVFEYQKGLQERIFGREDTAVQRRVADLKAAGLSPVLAAGQGAQSGAITKPQAPQMNTEVRLQDKMRSALDMMSQKKNIEVSSAQERLLNSQTAKNNMETDYLAKSAPGRIEKVNLENVFSEKSMQNRLDKLQGEVDLLGERKLNEQLDNQLKQYNLNILPEEFLAKVEVYAQMIQKTIKLQRDTAYKSALITLLETQTDQAKHDYQLFKETGQTSKGRAIYKDIDVDLDFGDAPEERGLFNKVGDWVADILGL